MDDSSRFFTIEDAKLEEIFKVLDGGLRQPSRSDDERKKIQLYFCTEFSLEDEDRLITYCKENDVYISFSETYCCFVLGCDPLMLGRDPRTHPNLYMDEFYVDAFEAVRPCLLTLLLRLYYECCASQNEAENDAMMHNFLRFSEYLEREDFGHLIIQTYASDTFLWSILLDGGAKEVTRGFLSRVGHSATLCASFIERVLRVTDTGRDLTGRLFGVLFSLRSAHAVTILLDRPDSDSVWAYRHGDYPAGVKSLFLICLWNLFYAVEKACVQPPPLLDDDARLLVDTQGNTDRLLMRFSATDGATEITEADVWCATDPSKFQSLLSRILSSAVDYDDEGFKKFFMDLVHHAPSEVLWGTDERGGSILHRQFVARYGEEAWFGGLDALFARNPPATIWTTPMGCVGTPLSFAVHFNGRSTVEIFLAVGGPEQLKIKGTDGLIPVDSAAMLLNNAEPPEAARETFEFLSGGCIGRNTKGCI